MSNIQFGIGINPSTADGADPVGEARAAEEAGFDFVSANDHLHATGPRHELWTLLTWIAASTTRIGVATRVLGVPFRHPAVTAKMAESLDRLSGGRLILGLGAGASEDELRALGMSPASLRGRVEALEEAIGLMRGLWSGRPHRASGRTYSLDGAHFEPSATRPIPIWLGTLGPRGLEMTGRLADGWIPSIELAPPDRVPGLIDRIRRAADDAGRDDGAITLAYNITIQLGAPEHDESHRLTGSTTQIAERLAEFTRLGFTAFNLIPMGEDRPNQIRELGSVVAAMRAH